MRFSFISLPLPRLSLDKPAELKWVRLPERVPGGPKAAISVRLRIQFFKWGGVVKNPTRYAFLPPWNLSFDVLVDGPTIAFALFASGFELGSLKREPTVPPTKPPWFSLWQLSLSSQIKIRARRSCQARPRNLYLPASWYEAHVAS